MLNAFNAQADAEALSRDEIYSKDTEPEPEPEPDVQASDASDVSSPADSTEWPPTPDPNLLPPDSSLPVTDRSDSELVVELQHASTLSRATSYKSDPGAVEQGISLTQESSSSHVSKSSSQLDNTQISLEGTQRSQERSPRLFEGPGPKGILEGMTALGTLSDNGDSFSMKASHVEATVGTRNVMALGTSLVPSATVSPKSVIHLSSSIAAAPFVQVKNTPMTDLHARTISQSADDNDMSISSSTRDQISAAAQERCDSMPLPTQGSLETINGSISTHRQTTPYVAIPVLNASREHVNRDRSQMASTLPGNSSQDVVNSPTRAIPTISEQQCGPAHRPQASALDITSDETSPEQSPTRKRPALDVYHKTKRRRRNVVPLSLNISDLQGKLQDPAVSARAHRQQWFAARRNSESSNSRGSFTSGQEGTKSTTPKQREPQMTQTPFKTKLASPDLTLDTATRNDAHDGSIPDASRTIGGLGNPQQSTQAFEISKPAVESAASSRSRTDEEHKRSSSMSDRQLQSVSEPSLPADKTLVSFVFDSGNRCVAQNHQMSAQTIETIATGGSSTVTDIFERFKNAYVDYTGDVLHFTAMCRMLEKDIDTSLPLSLWDDFVIRHNQEYSRFLNQCSQTGNECAPYHKYFQSKVEEPLYGRKILNQSSIKEALIDDPPRNRPLQSNCGQSPIHPEAVMPSPVSAIPDEAKTTESFPGSPPTIDLTNEFDSPVQDSQPKKEGLVTKRGRGVLPWNKMRRPSHVQVHSPKRYESLEQDSAIPTSVSPSVIIDQGSMPARTNAIQQVANFRRPKAALLDNSQQGKIQSTYSRLQESNERLGQTIFQQSRSRRSTSRTRLEWDSEIREGQGENDPLKIFIREYKAIRPGRGNSWATQQAREAAERPQSPTRPEHSGWRRLGSLNKPGWRI